MLSDLERALRDLIKDAVREVLREQAPAQPVPEAPPQEHRYVTPVEAAKLVSVSAATIKQWACKGELKAYRAGRSLRILVPELHEYMRRQAVRPERAVHVDDVVARIVRGEGERCTTCGHLPSTHAGGGPCRVRTCKCTQLRSTAA